MDSSIRRLLAEHAGLSTPEAALSDTDDLYAAGLTSFSAVRLMLALEEALEIEFPETLVTRRTFSSIVNLREALALAGAQPVA